MLLITPSAGGMWGRAKACVVGLAPSTQIWWWRHPDLRAEVPGVPTLGGGRCGGGGKLQLGMAARRRWDVEVLYLAGRLGVVVVKVAGVVAVDACIRGGGCWDEER